MKAIILERKGEYAAALREDGTVVKTRLPGEVGTEIELEAEILRLPARNRRFLRSAVAAAVAVMILGGSSTYVFAMPAAYVSMDAGESSVELSVNRVGWVISVKPTSEDDAEVAQKLSAEVRGKRVEDALAQTMTVFREAGYLDGQDAAIIAGVTSDSETRGAELNEALENAATRSGGELPLYMLEVSPAEREEAHAHALSGGRYVFERDGAPPREPAPPEPPQREAAGGESNVPKETASPAFAPAPTDAGPARKDAPESAPAPTPEGKPAEAAKPQDGGPTDAPPPQGSGQEQGGTPPPQVPDTAPQPQEETLPPAPPAQAWPAESGVPAANPASELPPESAPPPQDSPPDTGAAAGGPSAEMPAGEPAEPPQGEKNDDTGEAPDAPGAQAANGPSENGSPGEAERNSTPLQNGGPAPIPPDGGDAPGPANHERGRTMSGGRNGGFQPG